MRYLQGDTKCDFITRCGHWFHEACLKAWLAKQHVCPCCKQTASSHKMKELIWSNLRKSKLNEARVTEVTNFYDTFLSIPDRGDVYRKDILSYDIEYIKLLVDAKWNINDKNEGGLHLIRKACEKDDIYRLNALFEKTV